MTGVIRRRAGVDENIALAAASLRSHSPPAGVRFVENVESTLARLAAMPTVGSPKSYANPRLPELRSWSVDGFPQYLIPSLPTDEGIAVLAVWHGARHNERLVAERI